MPTEYMTLVAALKLLDIPFAEYGWATRPEGAYGVVSLDFESGSHDGDGLKLDRSWEASVDIFFYKLTDRTDLMAAVEETLTDVCGDSWELNSASYETETGLFHVEWVCRLFGDIAEEDDD